MNRMLTGLRARCLAAAALWILIAAPGLAQEPRDDRAAIGAVLDTLHRAAGAADGESYFALFAADGVFIGTDVTERWTVAELRAFAEPYFSTGRGWTYTPRERHVSLAADGGTAWFDELLDNGSFGTCRGTGVLVRTGAGWRIAQYHLTIPIPNDLARELTARIREHQDGAVE